MIIVPLTEQEALGWEYSQSTDNRNAARDFIFLKLVTQGVNRAEASEIAETLADAGERARVKIKEVTQFQIQVVAE